MKCLTVVHLESAVGTGREFKPKEAEEEDLISIPVVYNFALSDNTTVVGAY